MATLHVLPHDHGVAHVYAFIYVALRLLLLIYGWLIPFWLHVYALTPVVRLFPLLIRVYVCRVVAPVITVTLPGYVAVGYGCCHGCDSRWHVIARLPVGPVTVDFDILRVRYRGYVDLYVVRV